MFFSRWWVAAFFFQKDHHYLGEKKRPVFDLICCHRLVLDPFPWKRLNARASDSAPESVKWMLEVDGWKASGVRLNKIPTGVVDDT